MQNIIETLVELAKHALDIIVWKLSQELESLAKVSNDLRFSCASSSRTRNVMRQYIFCACPLSGLIILYKNDIRTDRIFDL